MDKYLFKKRVSNRCMVKMKELYDNEIADDKLVQSYLDHRRWKKFKNQLVEDIVYHGTG